MANTQTVKTLVVRESFVGKVGNTERSFREGELIHSDDPAVEKWPKMFGEPRFLHEALKVEQATSAPGERR